MKKLHILFLTILMAVTSFITTAQSPFTAGNIVVVRLGDGNSTSGTRAIFLDEYTPVGALVQSIALPTTNSGSNLGMSSVWYKGYLDFLTLSSNKQFLTYFGYAIPPGTPTGGLIDDPNLFNRAIARIDFNGIVHSFTSILGTDVAQSFDNA